MFGGRRQSQHLAKFAVGVQPPPAEEALTVLPQDLEAVLSLSADPNGQSHRPHSIG
jgi:hypothetical protein